MNEKLNGLSNRLCVENDCGQWSASYSGYGTSCYQGLKSEDGSMVALAVAHDAEPFGDPDTRENARRLAACWNACEGVPIEVIESGMAGGMPWSVPDQIEKMIERDELLAALQGLMREWTTPAEYLSASKAARAVLEKATGKTSEAA